MRSLTVAALMIGIARGDETAKAPAKIDATTMRQKVMCGYQGWFRCLGDGTDEGWLHWSRNHSHVTARSVTVEMWPDMSEYSDEEQYQVLGFTDAEKKPSTLFSSAHPKTVQRHFEWMEQYGIDGVFVQRFLVNLGKPSFERVLENVRTSAAKTGRTYAIGYDLSGARTSTIVEQLANDWRKLVEARKVTSDDRYLHHENKPVVFLWGFFSDRFDAATAHRLLDIFQNDGPYKATVIGGCPWYWRNEKDADWAKVYRRFDVMSPWNVGNYYHDGDKKYASTGTWSDDKKAADDSGMELLPVIYPGFGWTNLKGPDTAKQTIPRLGGEFYWRQFVAAKELGIDMAYVAMFDEVDESTAIFKVANHPPTQAPFATLEGLPSDWYLRLTGEGTKLLRGERREIAMPKVER